MYSNNSINGAGQDSGALTVGQRMERIEESVKDLEKSFHESQQKTDEKLDALIVMVTDTETLKVRVSILEKLTYTAVGLLAASLIGWGVLEFVDMAKAHAQPPAEVGRK